MLTVSSQRLQTKFGEISDIAKSREPVIITQYNRPTMVPCNHQDMMALMRLAAKMRFIERLDKHAHYAAEPTNEAPTELNQLIDEEREIVCQENLKKNAK